MKRPEDMTLLELQSAVHKLQNQVQNMRACNNCEYDFNCTENPNSRKECVPFNLKYWKYGG